ncbi:MAG: tetratricopeptide repeat protein [Myxococcales bacterium]|nr:tetratricopeptide repeat protein [Myxococcales bacterium]
MKFSVVAICLCAHVAVSVAEPHSGVSPDANRRAVLNNAELAMNQGDSYRMSLSELAQLIRDPQAVVWQFSGTNWMKTDRGGKYVPLQAVLDEAPDKRLHDVLTGFRLDMDNDGTQEIVLLARVDNDKNDKHFGITLLVRGSDGLTPIYYPQSLPGRYYTVEDIRDHDGDGRLELMIGSHAGDNEFYSYYGILAFDSKQTLRVYTTTAPDTLHMMDLDQDGQFEFLVRHLVSRKGAAQLWTWVDQVVVWNGDGFEQEPQRFVRYHDQVTKPRLIDELIDHFDADLFLLKSKVDVLRQIHAHILAKKTINAQDDDVVSRANRLFKANKRAQAIAALRGALEKNPYRVDVLRELANVFVEAGKYQEALALYYQALAAQPDVTSLWVSIGVCYSRLQERTAAIASFHNSVTLSEEPTARRATLERALSSEKDEQTKVNMQAALDVLDGRPMPTLPSSDNDVLPD